jgi:hypothetical protein
VACANDGCTPSHAPPNVTSHAPGVVGQLLDIVPAQTVMTPAGETATPVP